MIYLLFTVHIHFQIVLVAIVNFVDIDVGTQKLMFSLFSNWSFVPLCQN